MTKTAIFALATSFVVGLGSAAMAGEGSADLAQPSYSAHESDPDGSTYPTFQGSNTGWQGQYSVAPRSRDTNTGRAVRQHNYEDRTGINGE